MSGLAEAKDRFRDWEAANPTISSRLLPEDILVVIGRRVGGGSFARYSIRRAVLTNQEPNDGEAI